MEYEDSGGNKFKGKSKEVQTFEMPDGLF